MADSNQVSQSGGGEGFVPPESPAAVKSTEPQNTEQNVVDIKPAQEAAPVESVAELTRAEVAPTESTAASKVAPITELAPASEVAPPTELVPASESTPPTESIAASKVAPPTELAPASEVAPPTELAPPSEVAPPTELARPAELAPSTELTPATEATKPPVSVQSVESNTEQNATVQETQTTPIISPSDIDWQQREAQLLKKIEELELLKNEKSQDSAKLLLKVREEEIDLLKARVRNLETELHAALSKPGGKNHEMIENIKQQHEELLSKARGMIFDKTKMVKNQELQIEALTTQVQSLKDINLITKDLLEIRNSEIKAMEERLQAMEARFKTEKERYGLILQRAQTSASVNDDLKKEYDTQLAIFKELREKYEQKVKALVAENERLKASVQGGTSGQ